MTHESGAARILYVEDDSLLASLTLAYFASQQIEAVHVKDGEQAFSRLENEHFKLIVTDLNMPNIDGLEFIRRLRAQGIKTPIIITTGVTDPQVYEQLHALGVTKIYSKPLLPAVYKEFAELVKHTND